MTNDKLIIGMPAGSLADPNRGGNLITLLKAAGFPTKGYDQGGPTVFPLHAMMMGWDGRPQEFGAQLALEQLDIAIGGDDWMRERQLEYLYEYGQDIALEKVQSLQRGGVRIVIIHRPLPAGVTFDAWLKEQLAAKPVVSMVSEMPFLAVDWFKKKLAALGVPDSHSAFSVQKFMTPPKIDSGLVVYETWGKTEAKVLNEAVDFGVEITQTGGAIRNYGLIIGEEIMRSETGIWVNPSLRQRPEKLELARMFLLNLYGALYAENKVLMFFNTKREAVDATLEYLRTHQLFADEPTMIQGSAFAEFSVQMDCARADLPLAKVRYDLAKLGASYIETVPLESCIPGLDAISL